MHDIVETPWTVKQVAALNTYQQAGWMHPYTCGKDECDGVLVATMHGWECPYCEYRQYWAHAFSLNPPPNPFRVDL